MTDHEGRISASDVEVSTNAAGNYTASIKCLLCDPPKVYVLCGNKYTVEINNWKRHVTLKHLEKGTELKEGMTVNILKNKQRKLDQFLKK